VRTLEAIVSLVVAYNVKRQYFYRKVHLCPRLEVTEIVSMSAGLHVLYSQTDAQQRRGCRSLCYSYQATQCLFSSYFGRIDSLEVSGTRASVLNDALCLSGRVFDLTSIVFNEARGGI